MRKAAFVIAAGLSLLIPMGLLFAWDATREPGQPPSPDEGDFKLFDLVESKAGKFQLKVTRGNATEAKDYYDQIQRPLGLTLALQKTTIDDVLKYMGYGELKAVDLEQKPPPSGEILSTRFFAPKIIDVSGQTVPFQYGWRKIVRLNAREGSAAQKAKIQTFYLLFNFASTDPKFPAGKNAGQIQAILVPSYPHEPTHRDIYFFVFNTLNGKCPDPDGKPCPGTLGDHLIASFDFGGTAGPGKNDQYFVPRSCGQCHGTEQSTQQGGKVNYLDTDHWFDRIQPGDDFPQVKKEDVLVDGGEPAFEAIRKLNQEIRDQNKAVQATFQLAAVENWLKRHESYSGHLAPIDRPIPPSTSGGPIWTKGNPLDETLLPLLNRNCFRCHSSMKYHVFDKAAVTGRASSMESAIHSGYMPQDRKLSSETRKTMETLLCRLYNPAGPCPSKQ